jgi:hypothetical protein
MRSIAERTHSFQMHHIPEGPSLFLADGTHPAELSMPFQPLDLITP